jgi:DNA-directed RNA polymerase subunit E'/Rpb7
MEHPVLFEEQVALTPKDLSKVITSLNAVLLEKLKLKLENKCSRHGFVIPDSLKLLSRSLGKSSNGRFVGDYMFYVQLQGNVINPPDGIVLSGEVIRKNKMGIYLHIKNAIRVIIPRDLHIGNEEFENLNIGDNVNVEIKKSRFQVNDDSILSVGIFRSKVGKDIVSEDENEDEDEIDILNDELEEDELEEDELEEDAESEESLEDIDNVETNEL